MSITTRAGIRSSFGLPSKPRSLAKAALALVVASSAALSAPAASAADLPEEAGVPHDAHLWSASHAGAATARIAADDGDSTYLAGTFEGTIDIGGPIVSEHGADGYVAKLGPRGEVLWTSHLADAGDQTITAVAADRAGNVIITGSTQISSNPIGGQVLGMAKVFVTKLSPEGETLWTVHFGDTHTGTGMGVAVDPEGNVTVTGRYNGVVKIGGEALVSAPGSQAGDVFVVRMSASGAVAWTRSFGDGAEQYGREIAVSASGDVLVSGLFFGALELGSQTHVSEKASAYVVKLDRRGRPRFSMNLGSSLGDIPKVAFDSKGNAVIAGSFFDKVDLGLGAIESAGEDDLFVAKLDANGGAIFTQRFGDEHSQMMGDIALDALDQIVLGASAIGDVDFGDGPLACGGGYDAVVVKLDDGGHVLWSQGYGDQGDQLATDVVVTGEGNVVVAGQFAGAIDLGGGALESEGGFDLFLGALRP